MARHAIVNKDNKVVNVIEWDNRYQWTPPHDHTPIKIDHDNIGIGDRFDKKKDRFIKNNEE